MGAMFRGEGKARDLKASVALVAALALVFLFVSGFNPTQIPNPNSSHQKAASELKESIDLWPHRGRGLLSAHVSRDGLMSANVPGEQAAGYPHEIQRMCIVGERHSGTTWLEKTINMNFRGGQPNKFGMARENCFRHKHWFHFPGLVEPLVEDGDLIFVVFRNAVDWLLSFSKEPHHSHNHMNLPFDEFLTRPWVYGVRNDSCAAEEYMEWLATPYYETYRATFGGPFPEGPIRDVMQLRAMKLHNFLRLRDWIPFGRDRVIFVRYEDLVDNAGQGMQALMDEVKARFKIAGLCRTDGAPSVVNSDYKGDKQQPRNMSSFQLAQVDYHRDISKTKFNSPEAVRAFLRGVDFELENRLGYTYDYLRTDAA